MEVANLGCQPARGICFNDMNSVDAYGVDDRVAFYVDLSRPGEQYPARWDGWGKVRGMRTFWSLALFLSEFVDE